MDRDLTLDYRRNAAKLVAGHVPLQEHDACGVGCVVAIDGQPRREVIELGVEALKSLWHRGAVDADGKTGDGAGICIQIPQQFFRDNIRALELDLPPSDLVVGQIFLPRLDLGAQEICRCIVEAEILGFGCRVLNWRRVPIDSQCIGTKAEASRPEIEQIIIIPPAGLTDSQLDLRLYLIRRRIEKAVCQARIEDFYICSLSSRVIVYKGMFLAEQLSNFYPDLLDPRFISNFALYHQRYSTNTFPTWQLAQPFRMLAHNGEINTLKGNINWMRAHEPRVEHPDLANHLDDIKPVIAEGLSDSGALDAVFELMVCAGRPVPMAKILLVPPSKFQADPSHASLYEYCNSVMEPWDGPAALVAGDGKWVVAGMDRNGLRPMRYTQTHDGLLVLGSETGMVRLEETRVKVKGRVGAGEMIAVNLQEGKLYQDGQIKQWLAERHPFKDWIKQTTHIDRQKEVLPAQQEWSREHLRQQQICFGWSIEELELILQPMVENAKEPLGSMGDDSPLAVLSGSYRGLHHFFRQNFSQVTNPPIDSLRERQVMSLTTRIGNLGNILAESRQQCELLRLASPILTDEDFDQVCQHMEKHYCQPVFEIDCTFASDGSESLDQALHRICRQATDTLSRGLRHLVLTDQQTSAIRLPIPMILATGAVHTHLLRQRLRTYTSLNVRAGECLDVHYFAVLIGVGATTVNPYLALATIRDRHRRGICGQQSLTECVQCYVTAVEDGLLKIMSKMGIAVISSYRGGCNFEAVGLSRALIAKHMPSMISRISGIGAGGLERKLRQQHHLAFEENLPNLPIGGLHAYRHGGEPHSWEGQAIHTLQRAVISDDYRLYKRYVQQISAHINDHQRRPQQLREMLDWKPTQSIDLDEVESNTWIKRRFVTPGMSLGALSPEAHSTLNVAMNRLGAKSDSGEGGEDRRHYEREPNGDSRNSKIKQVASGRFGVTAEYLNQCEEIEIKIAQGAKPGEGGQLPGMKVTEMIATLRHATPGTSLISPPPHHDIYSIEDLAQLIYDLKQINPDARICVKLVARSGIGAVAAGVAKAHADVILISGHSGGTGASPRSSIKYTGIPWEMGLSEVNQILTLNQLRHRVILRTDGGLKTGRDIVIAAMLGAEEYGIGTAALVAMGCILVRQCHSNVCPVGICTQNESLRQKFKGTPESVINLFNFIADEVREILAQLGCKSLKDIIGRSDMLYQVARGTDYLDSLDLNSLLVRIDNGPRYCTIEGRNECPGGLGQQLFEAASALFDYGQKMVLERPVRNTDRSVGALVSSGIVRKFGMDVLEPDRLLVKLKGSAGQSLGAFAVQGLKLEVMGDANDYVGKSLSGGTIVVYPGPDSPTYENVILGNTVLYGATSGKLFAAGRVGERFAVRNSGAIAVVEGCGNNCCEYMTGGWVVILGSVGHNFAAGMTGGMTFIYHQDSLDSLQKKLNCESIIVQQLSDPDYQELVHQLVIEHEQETKSLRAQQLLGNWKQSVKHFWHISPKELQGRWPKVPNLQVVTAASRKKNRPAQSELATISG